MRVYIGWDKRDIQAFEVCCRSMRRHATVDLDIIPLKDWELRATGVYWRGYYVDGRGQMYDSTDGQPFSTDFSFARFSIPLMENFGEEWVVYCDPDFLWRDDIGKLREFMHGAVACVQHQHVPLEAQKMTGNLQTRYARKNWSSLMLMKPSECNLLTRYKTNTKPGAWLHGFRWVEDDRITAIPEEWNWLCGHSSDEIDPKVVHFTRGTPDMPGYENEPYADEWRGYVD